MFVHNFLFHSFLGWLISCANRLEPATTTNIGEIGLLTTSFASKRFISSFQLSCVGGLVLSVLVHEGCWKLAQVWVDPDDQPCQLFFVFNPISAHKMIHHKILSFRHWQTYIDLMMFQYFMVSLEASWNGWFPGPRNSLKRAAKFMTSAAGLFMPGGAVVFSKLVAYFIWPCSIL